MRKAIETYDRIVALEKFAKGKAKDWTYEMEFGRHRETDELLVYQFRKFRKKETADFKLEDLEIGKDSLRFNLAFGITPKEGIELIYRPSIPAKKGEDLSGNITRIIPMGTPEATYPHVALPGIKGIFYIDFKYSHNHGAREALMQVPFVLCDCTGVYVPSSFDQLNVLIPQLEEYAKLNVKLSSREVAKGAKLRLYSDGITGVIEFVEYAKIPA